MALNSNKKKKIFIRDHFRCGYCGNYFNASNLTIDHIIPKSQNGHSDPSNLITACVDCNQSKRNRTPAEARMALRYPVKNTLPSLQPIFSFIREMVYGKTRLKSNVRLDQYLLRERICKSRKEAWMLIRHVLALELVAKRSRRIRPRMIEDIVVTRRGFALVSKLKRTNQHHRRKQKSFYQPSRVSHEITVPNHLCKHRK